MPTTRRSAANARSRGLPAKGQSTLSFSNKVTKPVPKNAKKSIISSSVTKIDPSQLAKKQEAGDVVNDEPAVVEIEPIKADEEKTEVAPGPVKTESELQAEKVTDAQIKKYWKSIETQWSTPRLHQQGVSQNERILRYFDVSSQYGPCIGMPRMQRWKRADRLGLNPPIEVLAVLMKEETKGNDQIETAHMDEILNSIAVDT
ncbi:DNA polymerase delta, subunit 4-domain-containing protein [Fusarium venenatum]|uniref:DNA polymerase delta, subunit 4-domain-containing protein n=1 Tax=Fusarium venenatum TaxID=56646 RepID=UPI001D1B90F6|nr:DNA polymerase delta, subunit 4-domain-containing protein [Fusarium venenatum]